MLRQPIIVQNSGLTSHVITRPAYYILYCRWGRKLSIFATLVVIHETESFGGSVHMSSRVKSRDFFASRVCKR